MKQILQHLKTGKMELAELPCPQAGRGQVLIQTRTSLISAGTVSNKQTIHFKEVTKWQDSLLLRRKF